MSPSKVTLLDRLCRLQAMAVVIIAVAVIPMAMNQETLVAILQRWIPVELRNPLFLSIQGMLTASHETLILKECLVGLAVAVLVFFFALRHLAAPGDLDRADRRVFAAMAVVLVLAAVSALLWSPTFWFSLRTLMRMVWAVLFGVVVHSLARRRDGLDRGLALMVALAGLLCVVALLQHLGWTGGILPAPEGHRNRMGSLIGHNTGLSVFLLMALFPALAYVWTSPCRRRRIAAAAVAGLIVLVLVLAQSRSVWFLALILIPFYLIRSRRHAGLRLRWRQWAMGLAVTAAVVTSQFIEAPWNVLRVHNYPFMRRLYDLSPDMLQTETRLRILICSAPLIAQRPLVGHGLGAFQHVYPEAQMEYYTAHPFMWIAPTRNRTQRAHNDYLQLLIETGLVGLVVVGGGAVVMARRGLRRQRRALEEAPGRGMLHLAAGFSLLTLAGQGALDFPFHIIPLSMTGAFLLPLWATEPDRADGPAGQAGGRPAPWRPGLLEGGLLAGALVTVGLAVGLQGRELVADFYRMAAKSNYQMVREMGPEVDVRDKLGNLEYAEQFGHQRALRLDPHYLESHVERAQTLQLMGGLLLMGAREQEGAGAIATADQWRADAADRLAAAVAGATGALREFRNHLTYYVIGSSASRLYEATGERRHLATAIENLEMSVAYSPAYADSVFELSELYSREQMQPERITELRAMIARYNPDFYESRFLDVLYRETYTDNYASAAGAARALLDVARYNADHDSRYDDQAIRILGFYIQSLIHLNRLNEAEVELDGAEAQYPDTLAWKKIRVHLFCARQGFAGARILIRQIRADNADNPDDGFWETAEAMLATRLGQADSEERMAAVLEKAEDDVVYYNFLAQVADEFLRDRELTLKYLTIRCGLEPEPPARVIGRAATLNHEAGHVDEAARLARRALLRNPGFPRMRALLETIEAEEAGEAREAGEAGS